MILRSCFSISSTYYTLQLQLTSCLRLSLENRHLPTSFIEMIATANVSEGISSIDGSELMSFTAAVYEYNTRTRVEVEVSNVFLAIRVVLHMLILLVVLEICSRPREARV
jgi:hypothetical protein